MAAPLTLEELLARLRAGERLDFDALERAHPGQRDVVAAAREHARRTGSPPVAPAGSFAARLRAQYGADVDPGIALGGSGDAPADGEREILERLSAHGPKSSRYRVEGEVARGGMGAILRVWDEDLRRRLAMKVILDRGQGGARLDASQLARFLEEAQVTGQLDHPGIVPVHELGLDDDGRVFFTMKLVKGRDLEHVFGLVFAGTDGWNETRALSVVLRACEALAYAHAKGVIHRDLKPANVMVGDFGEVYVMDWGLARVMGRADEPGRAAAAQPERVTTDRDRHRHDASHSELLTMDGTIVGTPAYMSPEQAKGEIARLGPRSDVYSVGAMLYHLLARHPPYVDPARASDNLAVLRLAWAGPPAPLATSRPDAPPELVAIVEKAMARDPGGRYEDTLSLAADLRAYLENRVVSAYETGAWAETRKWIVRNKALAGALLGGLVVLVAGLVYSTIQTREARAARTETEAANSKLSSANEHLSAETARANAKSVEAEDNARDARRARDEATQRANDVLSLSAQKDLDDLVAEAATLWPAEPATIARCEDWLRRARELVEGRAADDARGLRKRPSLAEHCAKLAELRRDAVAPAADAGGAAAAPGAFTYADPEKAWWDRSLSKLVDELEALRDPAHGLMNDVVAAPFGWGVAKRLSFARTIRARSVDAPEARRRWDEAIAAIRASPRYDGLVVAPQIGLVPIGPDPVSGLWEFAHLQTGTDAGAVPARDEHGRLVIGEETGLVFVLVPGGTFTMGAQKQDPLAPNHDPGTRDDEGPVHTVTLSPFFLSKYEMTQGQWQRIAAVNPSYYHPPTNLVPTNTHPVEDVNWLACHELTTHLGLELPSEAQWEYAARAGTSTPWWTGAERESLRGKTNIADQTAAKAGATWPSIRDWPDLVDGSVVHAAVGTYPPNAFGLHEVTGNVWEWCRDGYDARFYARSPAVDPVCPPESSGSRVYRGGGFSIPAPLARCAYRYDDAATGQDDNVGLRPARALRGPLAETADGK